MLHNARPIHAINIRQRNRLRVLVHPHVDKPDVAVKVLAENLEVGVRDNPRKLRSIGVPSLSIKGVVLDEVDVNVGVECFRGVLLGVKDLGEVEEDLLLFVGVGVAGGTVGLFAASLEEGGGRLTKLVGWERCGKEERKRRDS